MKIFLTPEFRATIDDEDGELVAPHRWRLLRTGGRRYAYTRIGMKTVYMHRLILGLGADESVDHKDGDGLNNTRANLRPATHQQNLCNQILSAANTSGFKGVIRREQRNMTAWRAQIKFRGQNIFIGNYPTPEDAARAYDRKALELFGSFAKTNEQLGLLAA